MNAVIDPKKDDQQFNTVILEVNDSIELKSVIHAVVDNIIWI